MRRKILFLIHDLGAGGAEKVLVNLVNNMDRTKFDISVTVLFGGGVNEQYLAPDIHFRAIYPREIPANSKWMKLFTPEQLHRMYIKERYDIEVSYLEGPSARVISGCTDEATKLVSWIHVEQHTMRRLAASFRTAKEAKQCYNRFDRTICVSRFVHDDFCKILGFKNPCEVLYNTVESEKIRQGAQEDVPEFANKDELRFIGIGTLKESKGFDRLLRITKRLTEERYKVHLYLLGRGPLQNEFENFIRENHLQHVITLLGYHTNPYKYVAKCDCFVCSSHSEGFSTAATEALIVGTPVCTVEVSGMREMLGENEEYGMITQNSEEALYQGIKKLLDDLALLAHYKRQAEIRGKTFGTENTVRAVEEMLMSL